MKEEKCTEEKNAKVKEMFAEEKNLKKKETENKTVGEQIQEESKTERT